MMDPKMFKLILLGFIALFLSGVGGLLGGVVAYKVSKGKTLVRLDPRHSSVLDPRSHAEAKARVSADFENVDIRIHDVIYDVVDEVERAMLGLLPPRIVETKSGKAEVKQAFEISKYGTVAGCMVVEGKIVKGSKARVIRNEDIIYEGEVTSLKRFKDDAKEAISGQDCGIFLGDYDKFQEGDIIESFLVDEVARTAL